MGLGMRQWKALMRKNFINWKRQAKCSFFEICCPAVVMYLMVILRGVVDVTTVPMDQLLAVRQPTFVGATWTWNEPEKETGPDYGTWNFLDYGTINDDVTSFFEYDSYPVLNPTTSTNKYNVLDDKFGPFYFIPSNCLKINSFQVPKVASPIIAVVGPNNKAQYMIKNYLQQLTDLQWKHKSTADSWLKKSQDDQEAELP